jgi:monoamine oxidase
MATRDQRQFSAVWLRHQVRASRAATTFESWRATKPATMGIVQCNEPDGPFFAGEPLSHIGAWQEGAILSAKRAFKFID